MVIRLTITIFGLMSMIQTVYAEENRNAPTVRFYKINKHQQTSKIKVSKKKTQQAGCHNFSRAKKVFHLIQTGYNACYLYAEKNCSDNSKINATNTKNDTYSEALTEGLAWQPRALSTALNSTDNKKQKVKVRSWVCE